MHLTSWAPYAVVKPITGRGLNDAKLKKIVKFFLSSKQLCRGEPTSHCKGWPAISDDGVLDTMLWCLISHLRSSEMGKV